MAPTTSGSATGIPTPTARPDCVPVSVAASSEKAALMGKIAVSYSQSGRTVDGKCYDITVRSVASGTAETALANDWDPDVYGAQPDVWTPAASTWIGLLRNDLQTNDKPAEIVPDTSESVTSTPAGAGHAGADGRPRWAGPRPNSAGRTCSAWSRRRAAGRPRVTRSGAPSRSARPTRTRRPPAWRPPSGTLVAATGTSSDLTLADLKDAKVRDFAETVERSVIHYGDTTLTYLSNLQRADDAGAALNYVSAVAVEEKSVLDYNAGNPTGDPATLGQHKPPRVPLVAIYPKEGTLYSDSPYVVLNASWSTPEKQAGAKDFLEYLRLPEQQKVFTDANFRTYDGKAGTPITSSQYVDADGVKITLKPPAANVLAGVRDLWADLRKPARVLLVLDVSGSMGQPAGTEGKTRLDLAKKAATNGLSQLNDTDEIGLWAFTTGMDSPAGYYQELVPIAAKKQSEAEIKSQIEALSPSKATPLYAVTRAASDFMTGSEDEDKINAVVLMTDGQNEYTPDSDLERPAGQADPQRPGERRARLHHRLRRGRRPGHPQEDQRGHQGRGIRCPEAGEHQQGVRRRPVQLLTAPFRPVGGRGVSRSA